MVGVVAGATGICDSGVWTVTVEFINLPEEEGNFSEVLEICTVDPVYINIQ